MPSPPDARLEVLEPATAAVLQSVPRAGVEDVDVAVAQARAAYPEWRAVAPGGRASVLFDDEEEAIRLANDTIDGLSGSVWSRDGGRALRVARALEAGVLSINSNTAVGVATPFGGLKQSGYGRELGPHALDPYTEVKSIFYSTS